MDLKKRKVEENGAPEILTEGFTKLIDSFTKEQLLEIVKMASSLHPDVLEEVRKMAEKDPVQRKIFVRALGWETTTESLSTAFSKYGDLQEAAVIMDKSTGKSRGFGFVTFRRIDGAMRALQEPSKIIDGRVTVSQLAALGSTPIQSAQDVVQRKIYVGNVPVDLAADKLLGLFAPYGEIEEGPLGYDKATGKSRGYALLIFKTVEGAKKALEDPVKISDGHQLYCKLAAEGFKPKENADGRKSTVMQLPARPAGGAPPILSGYSLPLGTVTPSVLGSGLSLGQGITQGLGHGHLPTHLSSHVQGLSDLGQSFNPSLSTLNYPFTPSNYSLTPSNYSLPPSLTASLNPSLNSSLSSLSSQSLGHGLLSGMGSGLHVQSSSGLPSLGPSGLASLGSYSADLGSYSGQLGAAYSRLGASSLYGGASSLYGASMSEALSQASLLPGPSVASYSSAYSSAQLPASQSQSDGSASTLGLLRSSHYPF